MRLTYKYRLYPTKAQAAFLGGQLREACDLYNCALQERIGAWKASRKSINYYDQANQLKAMRAEGLIGLANYSCCQDVLRRLDKAFVAFYRRVKSGDRPGFPRYKVFRRYESITFPDAEHGWTLKTRLRIQGAGQVKIKLHRPIQGKIKTLTIKREADRWFACFSVDMSPQPLPNSESAVGIDVGLTTFATLSDGSEIDNPRHRERAARKIRVLDRSLTRKKRTSNRRRKAVLALRRAHVDVRNQRSDFHHQISRRIVNKHGLIAIENLNIQGLAATRLSKSVTEAGWGQFFTFLSYKAESAGRVLVRVDPNGTSQMCLCGTKIPKTLDDRWHECHVCGLSAGRDHVSARVILQRARIERSRLNVEVVNSSVLRESFA